MYIWIPIGKTLPKGLSLKSIKPLRLIGELSVTEYKQPSAVKKTSTHQECSKWKNARQAFRTMYSIQMQGGSKTQGNSTNQSDGLKDNTVA